MGNVDVRLRLAAALLVSLAGCGRTPQRTAPEAATRVDPGFRAPPSVVAAERDGGGAVVLQGRASPGSTVSLRSPDGASFAPVADAAGRWSLRLPPASLPRAFAMSAQAAGRAVRAEGALLVAPAPFAVAMSLRGGAPALPVAAPGAGFRWTSFDTDPGGGAAASGFAPPGAMLRLAIDGIVRGEGAADASGRFGVLWLGGAVPPGAHAVTVATTGAQRTVAVRFGPADLRGAPLRESRDGDEWRVDWAPPGGGVQTLHLLAPVADAQAVR